MPQRLWEVVEAVLAVAGDRGEVGLQEGLDTLEARQPESPIDRADHGQGLTHEVLVADVAEPTYGDEAPLIEVGVVRLRVDAEDRVVPVQRRTALELEDGLDRAD